MNTNIEPDSDIEQPVYETRYFIGVDKDNYVNSMMIAFTAEEAETYTQQGLQMLSADVFESIGQDSQYIDGEVIQGAPRVVELTAEAAKTIAASKISEATIRINILQDEIDLDLSTGAGVAELKVWKAYRIALNRLDLSAAPDIEWPQYPG
ncbi:tail fiber assembly protein [Rahnella perminowiae]|uniref:tail fiber assembly protein n=1 Tax=Rahnella perminowiae TaxID=2816244 RepID=UPI0036616DBC